MNAEESATSQIDEIIRKDPSLSTRLLRMVNTVYFGLSARINNIEEAVFFLGLRRIRELALATPVIEDLEKLQSTGISPRKWKDLWAHSVGAATLSRDILSAAPIKIDDDTDYLVGLLHNVGKIVMAYAFPEELLAVAAAPLAAPEEICVLERELIGWDHAQIGAYYLERHQIAEEIVFAVRYHHDPMHAPCHHFFAAAVQVADSMLRHSGLSGGFENTAPVPADAWKRTAGLADPLWRKRSPRRRGEGWAPVVRPGGPAVNPGAPLATAMTIAPDAPLVPASLIGPWAGHHRPCLLPGSCRPDDRREPRLPAQVRPAHLGPARARGREPDQRGRPPLLPLRRRGTGPAAPPGRAGPPLAHPAGLALDFLGGDDALRPRGAPAAVRAIGHDITRQRLAEEIYLKLSHAVEQSPVSVIITDADGRVQYVNPKFTQVSGYTLEEVIERNLPLLREGHPSDERYDEFWSVVRSGREWQGELTRQRPGGATVCESVQVSSLRNATGEITNLLCLREDITARKRLEEQLRQAQKMESLGTLAGGIAHDFNNLLAVINGYAELSQQQSSANPSLQKNLREIKRATQRATGLVRQILTFSRKAEADFTPLDLNQLVKDLVALLSETFPRSIQITLNLADTLPALLADQNQIQQILLNLCVNARDAMPNGGAITVTTSVVPGSGLPNLGAEADRNYACLQATDEGTGMTPEVRARIFEPFFTTKSEKGTGLGLAVVYGIVASHHGFLEVDSTLGVGSTFKIYLPFAGTTLAPPVAPQPNYFPGGKESLLVVDDEGPLRNLLKVAFVRKGYQVVRASDGLEAIDLINDPACTIHAVLLDFNMPGATGLEVLKTIIVRRPELRVLVLSGHLAPDVRVEFERLGQKDFVNKPYTLDELGRRLRALLDA